MTRTSGARTAAIYVRISQDREGAGLGVQRQREDCEALAQRERLTVRRVYVDNDRSAYSGKVRPEYEQLLADIRAGVVDAVIVWHTDRLHRNIRELGEYIDACRTHDVPTFTVKAGQLDLATATGRMQAGFAGLIAQHESEHRAERLQRKHQQSAEAGIYRGGSRPFGYNPGGMTVCEPEAEELRRMAKAVLAGESLGALIRDLNDRGIRTTVGNAWSYATLRQLLVRPRIAGLSVYRGQVVGDAQWPAIIGQDEWRALCVLLNDPARRKSKTNTHKHLLSGLAKCGKCGKGLKSAVMIDRSGNRRTIYRCHVYPSADPLDAKIALATLGMLGHPSVRAAMRPQDDGEHAKAQREAEALRSRLEDLAASFADGLISLPQLTAGTERINARLADVERVVSTDVRARTLEGLVGAADVLDRWRAMSVTRRRAVIDALIDVTVHRGGKVDVRLKTDLQPSEEDRPGFTTVGQPVPTADQLTDLSRLMADV